MRPRPLREGRARGGAGGKAGTSAPRGPRRVQATAARSMCAERPRDRGAGRIEWEGTKKGGQRRRSPAAAPAAAAAGRGRRSGALVVRAPATQLRRRSAGRFDAGPPVAQAVAVPDRSGRQGARLE